MMRRYQESKNNDALVLDNSTKCVNYFRMKYELKPVEEFYLLCLDSKRRLLSSHVVGTGLASTVDVPLGSLAAKISASGARAFVVIHNHPGGDESPTELDVIATKRFMDISISIGAQLDDHIIVTEDTFFSFHNRDVFKQLYNISKHNFKQSKDESVLVAQLIKDMKK